MYLTHGSRAGSVEGFGDRDGRRGARGTEDHREVRGIGDSSESLVGSDPGDIAGKQQPRTCRADAAPHDGRRPARGQEGAGCQRRFPVITARSMDCSSEPGVIVAGAGALPRARRRCEAGKRTHGPGPRACLALLAATALLALAAPAQAQTTTVTQSGDGATWSLVGENTVAAGQTYTYTVTRTSGSLPENEYFGFTSNTLEEERFKDDTSDCTGTNYFCFTISNSVDTYEEFTVSGVRFAGRRLEDTSPHVLTLNVATGTPAGTTVTLGVVDAFGGPRSGGLQITVGTAPTNTAPTAEDKTVTTGEDRAYAFTADDCGFDDDAAGATLASVTIVTVPALGTLALDGTAVMAAAVVTKAQIDGDMLTFTPARDAHGDPYTTFTFTVNDGTDDSASAYTMTIDVTDAPAPVCAVPDIAGAGRRQIWSGTVTVERGENAGFVYYGFNEGVAGTLLPSQSFSIGSNSYSIDGILVTTSGGLEFSLDGFGQLTDRENAALRLHVCDGDYDFNTADDYANTTPWTTTLDWSDPVVTRTVYLSLPANNAATGEPTITGTAQAGQDLTADASPIMDTDGLPASFTYQWVRVDADGTSNPVDITDANAATYTLTAADAGKKVKVKVSFTDELSGLETRTSAAYPSSGTVTTAASTTAPALLSVTVTSTPHKTTDTYGAREHIEFSMTFDAPVTVTGDPTFAFDLGGPTTASWYAGSGTTTLRFSHAVTGGSSGDEDTNGISWAENAIALNGGTIAGTDNAVAAVLTHVAQSNLAAHKVDGRTTAVTAATVTDVVVTSTPMLMASGSSTADTYGFGETIVITVTVSEAVEVEGDPEFEFSMNNPGGAANDVPATYDRTRSSATTMAFAYTVQPGDMDSDGIWIGTHSRTFMLDVNDRIRTASQQIDIDRRHRGVCRAARRAAPRIPRAVLAAPPRRTRRLARPAPGARTRSRRGRHLRRRTRRRARRPRAARRSRRTLRSARRGGPGPHRRAPQRRRGRLGMNAETGRAAGRRDRPKRARTPRGASVEALPATWRTQAKALRRYGGETPAVALESCAAELEATLRERDETTLSLTEAARESGYSADHLGRLVRDGKIPNAGRPGAPRIARRHLPRKTQAPATPLLVEKHRRGEVSNAQIVQSIIEGGIE